MANVWAIGDLHLSFGVKNKGMELFGPEWKDHAEKIAAHWKALIHPDDLVLIPGDISWAMRLEEVQADLEWIDRLPGTKVMIKGNHDYWWGSLKKVMAILPPSIHLIQNQAFHWRGIAVGGARLWDSPEYSFSSYIERRENPKAKQEEEEIQEELQEKIFERELVRLTLSLQSFRPDAKVRIAMTHYPPIGADLAPSRVSEILERFGVEIAVFGHLHSIKKELPLFGVKNGVRYLLASADYIHFQPIPLYPNKMKS
ncbi:MAG: metallophosphoesterase [Verrucomicrobiota bacterium]|nr:metallophosphoesterase [Verrucomicrobiota bacterium]